MFVSTQSNHAHGIAAQAQKERRSAPSTVVAIHAVAAGDATATRGGQVGAALQRLLRTWGDRVRQRRELSQLTARDLLDVGISNADAREEMRKPFWRR
jgi:uncharacterized protein YjiS (DUF1127 family)